jgi:hypothetical protein
MIKLASSILNFVAALGWVLIVALWWAPASFWLTYSLSVENAVAGGPSPKVTTEATLRKTIHLNWDYALWKWSGEAWIRKCSSAGDGFRPPDGPMTVETIFDGCARDLKAGEYSIQTDLAWDDMGAKSLGLDSDFEITEPDHSAVSIAGHHFTPIPPPVEPVSRAPHSPHRRHKSCLPFFLSSICY